jgi:hypothetical protein
MQPKSLKGGEMPHGLHVKDGGGEINRDLQAGNGPGLVRPA